MHMQRSRSSRLFPIVFHVVLWSIWLGLPIVNAGDNERFRLFAIWVLPVGLTNIPLFLLNTEWLIPGVLRHRGVPGYLLSLLLLVATFSLLQFFMKEWIIPPEIRFHRNDVFWAIIPVVFVTAISTGYGFIIYLNRQEHDRQEEQQERLKSELSFLRSQISPHFIFNVLNSIVYLIRARSSLAEAVTIRLSELMRYMLYTSEAERLPLTQEVDYLRNYIELQRIRFEDDVQITFRAETIDESALIEPMMLIPFVENAFKHGIGLVQDPVIDIWLRADRQRLDFIVRNKIAPESAAEKDRSSGIGLRNIRRRLELLHPDTHTLDIDTSDGWFVANLSLRFEATPATAQSAPHETPLHSRR
ncbi:MAG: histidine kinase [Bacteroidia bacterium]